jgi:hypothetical protein
MIDSFFQQIQFPYLQTKHGGTVGLKTCTLVVLEVVRNFKANSIPLPTATISMSFKISLISNLAQTANYITINVKFWKLVR